MPALSGVILSGGRSRRMGQDKALLMLGGRRLIDHVADVLGQLCDELIVVANDADRYASPQWRVVLDAFPGAGSLGGLYTGLQAARHPYAVAVACDMPFLNVELLRYLARSARGWDAAVPRLAPHPPAPLSHQGERRERGMIPSPPHPLAHQRVKGEKTSWDLSLSPSPGKGEGASERGEKKLTAKDVDLQPLHAVYHRRSAVAIRGRIARGDLRMIGFLADLRVRYVAGEVVQRLDPQGISFFNANTPEEWQAALERLNG